MVSDDSSDQLDDSSRRDVTVPLGLYKIVTVFSTLIAIIVVVAGFLVLDAATNRARAPAAEIDPVLALIGLGLIALGGIVYAFSSRFQAHGMGTPKDTDDEPSDDG